MDGGNACGHAHCGGGWSPLLGHDTCEACAQTSAGHDPCRGVPRWAGGRHATDPNGAVRGASSGTRAVSTWVL
eukprot:7128496-Pyramimonas_sp.AAC.1